MLVARALKNSQLTCGERHAYFGNRTLARPQKGFVNLTNLGAQYHRKFQFAPENFKDARNSFRTGKRHDAQPRPHLRE